jgi:hypothetical protein
MADTSLFMIYYPENIMGGGEDTVIRGTFTSLELAKAVSQDIVNRETFQRWLNAPNRVEIIRQQKWVDPIAKEKALLDAITRGQEVYDIDELQIMVMSQNVAVFTHIQSHYSVTATHSDPLIISHPRYEEYKAQFNKYITAHKRYT